MAILNWRLSATCLALMAGIAVVSCGGSGGGSAAGPTNTVLTPITGTVSLWAGSARQAGVADGPIATAQFAGPVGIVQDSAGNIYTSDQPSHTIRKISVDGQVTTLAGSPGQAGSADGVGSGARFASPAGMAIDSAGFLYVADQFNSTIRKISPGGTVTTLAGSAGQTGNQDGMGAAARFTFPKSLAISPNGDLFVADGNYTVRRIAPNGSVTTFAGSGVSVGSPAVGDGTSAGFLSLGAVAVDSLGVVYVADFLNLRKFNNLGQALPWGSVADGLVKGITSASAMSIQSSGDVFVVSGGSRPLAPGFSENYSAIFKVTAAGGIENIAGDNISGSEDGPGTVARFNRPKGLISSADGSLIIADTENFAIRKVDPLWNVSTYAGGSGLGSRNGLGTEARFSYPRGIAPSPDGGLYLADNNLPKIRKIDSAGQVTTRPLTDIYFQLGTRSISHMATDGVGNMAVASRSSTRGGGHVAFFDPQGVGIPGYAGISCQELEEVAIAFYKGGSYYKSCGVDIFENSTPGSSRLIATGFKRASALTTDPQGTVFVADREDHTIRAIMADGTVVLKAGQHGVAGYSNGGANVSLLNAPYALASDDAGNIYFADASSTIRRLSPNGTVQLVAGEAGKFETRLGALPGGLTTVKSLAWTSGSLYAVMLNSVIKITINPN